MIQYYSFLEEATASDYFVKTFGTFRFLFSGKSYSEVALKANLKGFKPIHLSKTMYGDPSSAYFIDPTKTKLLRISDHWSESNVGNVRTCGWIRKCYWRLLGKQGSKSQGSIQAGIIDLSKLQNPDEIINPNHNIRSVRRYFGDTLVDTSPKIKFDIKDHIRKIAKKQKVLK